MNYDRNEYIEKYNILKMKLNKYKIENWKNLLIKSVNRGG